MKTAENTRLWTASIFVSREGIAAAYLVAVGAAESLTVLVSAQVGLVLHGLILLVLLLHASFIDNRAKRGFLLTLSLAPLIRLLSLSLPFRLFPFVSWYLVVGAPLFLATLLLTRTTGLKRNMVGMRPRALTWQALVGLSGLCLGWIEYLILRPGPLVAALRWELVLLPALILLIFTGLLEELIFRGVLQHTATRYLGKAGILYGAAVFAILHLGYRSILDIFFVFGVALFFGWIVHRTGTILGVTVAHGLTNIGLYLVFPFLLAQPATPVELPREILAPYNAGPNMIFKATPTPRPPTPSPSPQPSATLAATQTEMILAQPTAIPTEILPDTPTLPPTATLWMTEESQAINPEPTVCGPPAGWVITIVQRGDTLSSLSVRYGVSISTLQAANCLPNASRIYTGQRLYVPFVLVPTPTILWLPSATPSAVPTLAIPTPTPVIATPVPVIATPVPVFPTPTEVPTVDPPTEAPPPDTPTAVPPMNTPTSPPPVESPVPPPPDVTTVESPQATSAANLPTTVP